MGLIAWFSSLADGRELVRYQAAAGAGNRRPFLSLLVQRRASCCELELTAPVTNNWVYYDVNDQRCRDR